MPDFVWLKLLPFFIFFSNVLGIAFPSAVSIAGNKCNTSATETSSEEKF